VPVTVIAGKGIAGFNPKQLTEALHININVVARYALETIPIIGRALEAVERVVRQMPDEKLGWTMPNRARPMREFTYHIFTVVQNTIEERSSEITSTRSGIKANTFTSFQDIAEYGRSVIEQYRVWAKKQDAATLPGQPPDGADTESRAERLDLLAGHTIQHLRQLYAVLESFGITPANRIPDGEWPPEYVLANLS